MNETALARELSRLTATLGAALRIVRLKNGMTQQEVADALSEVLETKLAQSYVSRVEMGDFPPSSNRFTAICQVLDTEPAVVVEIADSLARGENKSPKEATEELVEAMIAKLSDEDRETLLARLTKKLGRAVQAANDSNQPVFQ